MCDWCRHIEMINVNNDKWIGDLGSTWARHGFVIGFTPVGDSENSFSEYFDLRILLCFLLIIQGTNPFII